MTPDMLDLARRTVACKGWRWVPGMLAWRTTRRGERVQVRLIDGLDQRAELADPRQTTPSGTRLLESGHSVVDGWHRVEDLTPDLTDPATLGCLLALVREAWEPHRGSDYIASTIHTGSGWGVGARYGSDGLAAIVLPTHETEAEALVVALEVAP